MPHIDKSQLPDNTEVFAALCYARANLFAVGEYNLQKAVDELQTWAWASGLVAEIGQDQVQQIMAAAFSAVREDM